jgi:DNA-directed RNA polymerase sigma subunit (sigma70/sigma32)
VNDVGKACVDKVTTLNATHDKTLTDLKKDNAKEKAALIALHENKVNDVGKICVDKVTTLNATHEKTLTDLIKDKEKVSARLNARSEELEKSLNATLNGEPLIMIS